MVRGEEMPCSTLDRLVEDLILRSAPEQLQAALREGDDLALAVFGFLVVGFDGALDALVGDDLDHLDNLLRLGDQGDQFLVAGFEELEEGPRCNVLEGWVTAVEEPAEVAVDAAFRLGPVLNEDGIVTNCLTSALAR